MSVWKSPVFYFGILLVVLVTAALAAPYVVPWNSYRADLESYGQKLTGRSVSIGGDVAVKLFPWPQLEAKSVIVGNPDGFSDAAFVKADVVRLTLSLAGLFNGNLDVEDVTAVAPVVNLQRNASGDVNWIFAPTEQVTGQGLLSRVKLDKIQLTQGVVSFDDLRNGHSAVMSGINATLSAQSILGPWRMKGTATWNDLRVGVSVTTNAKTATDPLTFSVKLEPQDVSYPLMALEGAWQDGAFDGAMRVDPQETDGQKASAEGTLKPLAMQAKVRATEERLNLSELRIAPADRKDNGTLIEGAAVIEFGTQSLARLELKSPRVNLDTLMGAEAMQQWREGGLLSVSNTLLTHMPSRLVADFSLGINVLTSGGEALNDVRLSGSIQKEAIRVSEFSANLPGRSAARFDGVIFPGDEAAQLGGKLGFESSDFRAFLSWLNPPWKSAFDTHWTGSRGRFVMPQSTLDWTSRALTLKQAAFEFEGAQGTASLMQALAPRQATDLRLTMTSLDIDSLLPNGWSFLRDGGLPGLVNMAIQPQEGERQALALSLAGAAVQLNGVSAQDVMLDVATGPGGLAIKTLKIGNVGGAQLTGGGTLADQGNGPEGTLTFALRAQDPRGFLRLSGLARGDAPWTEALGQTAVDATVKAVPQKSGPELEIVARGTSGPLNMEVVATAREIDRLQGATLAASGGISTADSAALARLAGLEPVTATGPGDLTFEFKGSMAEGFAIGGMLKALDGVAELSGTAHPSKPYYGLNGKFSAKAADGAALLAASGLPLGPGAAQPLDIAATLSSKDGALDLLDAKATLAGRRFSGMATLATDGRLQADLETDLLDAKDVFALAFMPLAGEVQELAQGFAVPGEGGVVGEVFLKPLQFDTVTGGSASEVVIGIGLEKEARLLSITAPGEQGPKADLRMTPQGAAQKITGTVSWPFDLSKLVLDAGERALLSGQITFNGEVAATGRSPAAALAALESNGHYWLQDGKLTQMTLEGLADAVIGAGSPDALTAALGKLTSLPGTAIGQRIGDYSIANGEVTLSAITVPVDGVAVNLAARADLPAQRLRVETSIGLTPRPDLPPVLMTYEGQPGAIITRTGTSAIAAKLGYELLSKEMAELERLQEEQRQLALKEEAQRLEDERRFADYQATRAELREQARLRRFHQAQRDRRAADLKAIVDEAIKTGSQRSRIELIRHARRLAVRRGPPAVLPQP